MRQPHINNLLNLRDNMPNSNSRAVNAPVFYVNGEKHIISLGMLAVSHTYLLGLSGEPAGSPVVCVVPGRGKRVLPPRQSISLFNGMAVFVGDYSETNSVISETE